MADVNFGGSNVGGSLYHLLMTDDILPGDTASYELCKIIYCFHPLGARMCDRPVTLAMRQDREIALNLPGEDRLIEQFKRKWEELKIDDYITMHARTARIYGISSLVYGFKGEDTSKPTNIRNLGNPGIYFTNFDPLNTAGSLVLNQNPNDADFQKPVQVIVSGKKYHPSRSNVLQNEFPIYIEYNSSSFGFTGRSVYQRALYPLKSYVSSMITDDLVQRKVGVLIAKIKAPGSIINQQMLGAASYKRDIIKEASTNNVISIDVDEFIESMNLQNLDNPAKYSRDNIIANIALASDTPSKLLKDESLSKGFSSGEEDSKEIASHIEGIRKWMQPIYEFIDPLIMHQAWTEEYYETLKSDFPEYKRMAYRTFFYKCKNNFRAVWPSLISESESDRVKIDDTRLRSTVAALQSLAPIFDPKNKAALIEWVVTTFSSNESLFPDKLNLDLPALEAYLEKQDKLQEKQMKQAEKTNNLKGKGDISKNLSKAPYRVSQKKVKGEKK